jgi:hypothetical protein
VTGPFWQQALLLALVAGAGVLLGLVLSVWVLTPRRQRACARCGYEMPDAGVRTCPECGRVARTEGELFAGRRRIWPVTLAVVMVAGAWGWHWGGPRVRAGGWWNLVPTSVQARIWPGPLPSSLDHNFSWHFTLPVAKQPEWLAVLVDRALVVAGEPENTPGRKPDRTRRAIDILNRWARTPTPKVPFTEARLLAGMDLPDDQLAERFGGEVGRHGPVSAELAAARRDLLARVQAAQQRRGGPIAGSIAAFPGPGDDDARIAELLADRNWSLDEAIVKALVADPARHHVLAEILAGTNHAAIYGVLHQFGRERVKATQIPTLVELVVNQLEGPSSYGAMSSVEELGVEAEPFVIAVLERMTDPEKLDHWLYAVRRCDCSTVRTLDAMAAKLRDTRMSVSARIELHDAIAYVGARNDLREHPVPTALPLYHEAFDRARADASARREWLGDYAEPFSGEAAQVLARAMLADPGDELVRDSLVWAGVEPTPAALAERLRTDVQRADARREYEQAEALEALAQSLEAMASRAPASEHPTVSGDEGDHTTPDPAETPE